MLVTVNPPLSGQSISEWSASHENRQAKPAGCLEKRIEIYGEGRLPAPYASDLASAISLSGFAHVSKFRAHRSPNTLRRLHNFTTGSAGGDIEGDPLPLHSLERAGRHIGPVIPDRNRGRNRRQVCTMAQNDHREAGTRASGEP